MATATRKKPTRAKKVPTEAKQFKWHVETGSGYGEATPTNGSWVVLEPMPKGFRSYTSAMLYIYPESRTANRVQWNRYGTDAAPNSIHDGSEGVVIDYANHTITFTKAFELEPPPPPGPFDDSDERRAEIRKHSAAIRKAAEAMLEFDNVKEAAEAIGFVYDENSVSRSFYMGTDIDAEVADIKAKFEKARALDNAVHGLSRDEQKVVLRHLAHMFNIDKGVTSLR